MQYKLALALSLVFQGGFADEMPNPLKIVIPGIQSALAKPELHQELRTEILAMVEEDQSARIAILDYKNISDQERKTLRDIAKNHNHKLKEIIKTYGWPGIRLLGLEGAADVWILVQHQDQDLELQKECLTLLKKAVETQDAELRHYAYLLDRVRKNEKLPQVYGTQWEFKEGKLHLYPVESPETLNQRRLEAGLGTIEEYVEQMKKIYHLDDGDILR